MSGMNNVSIDDFLAGYRQETLSIRAFIAQDEEFDTSQFACSSAYKHLNFEEKVNCQNFWVHSDQTSSDSCQIRNLPTNLDQNQAEEVLNTHIHEVQLSKNRQQGSIGSIFSPLQLKLTPEMRKERRMAQNRVYQRRYREKKIQRQQIGCIKSLP